MHMSISSSPFSSWSCLLASALSLLSFISHSPLSLNFELGLKCTFHTLYCMWHILWVIWIYKLHEISVSTHAYTHRWEALKDLATKDSILVAALEKAKHIHDNWKHQVDRLADAQRKAYAEWKPCALPELRSRYVDDIIPITHST